MKVRFLTLAQQEVDEAFKWFERRTPGLGFEFLDELDRVVRLMRTIPLASSEIEPEIRRSLFSRFPYAIIYGIDDFTLVVIAVAHTHREPNYWIERVDLGNNEQ